MSGARAGQERAREARRAPRPALLRPRERFPPLRLPRDPPRGGPALSPHSPFAFPPPCPCHESSSAAAAARISARLRKCPDAPPACCTRARLREEGKGACEAGESRRECASWARAGRDAPPEGVERDGRMGG